MNVALMGVGLWAPGWPDVGAWRRQEREDAALQPRPGLLPPATARRSTFLARMVADVLGQALEEREVDLASLGLVLGTGGGELQTTFECLELQAGNPPGSSPLRFRNSVHNAALGHLSIALGATGYASALAADPDRLLAMALLEGMLRVVSSGTWCAVVVADETWPAHRFDPMAAAFVLAPEGTKAVLGTLSGLGRGEGEVGPVFVPDALVGQPCERALDLLAAVGTPEACVRLAAPSDAEPGWQVRWRRA